MKRPFAEQRPLGPFAQSNSLKTVLLTCDFEPSADMDDLESLVSDVGQEIFGGEVTDVRTESTGYEGGEGIRVVYDTKINAVFKQNADKFESRIESRIDDPMDVSGVDSELGKITIVATDR